MRVTLAELRLRAKQRANHERGNTIADDSEVDHYINLAIANLTGSLLGTAEFRPELTYEFQLDSTTEWYSLPDMTSLVSVHTGSGSTFHKIARAAVHGLNEPTRAGKYIDGMSYDVRRSLFEPDQMKIVGGQGSGTISIRYVPPFDRLVTDDACIYDRNYWSEFIVLHAAIQLLRKERYPVDFLMSAMEIEFQRIMSDTQRLDMHNSPRPDLTVGILAPGNRRNY